MNKVDDLGREAAKHTTTFENVFYSLSILIVIVPPEAQHLVSGSWAHAWPVLAHTMASYPKILLAQEAIATMHVASCPTILKQRHAARQRLSMSSRIRATRGATYPHP